MAIVAAPDPFRSAVQKSQRLQLSVSVPVPFRSLRAAWVGMDVQNAERLRFYWPFFLPMPPIMSPIIPPFPMPPPPPVPPMSPLASL